MFLALLALVGLLTALIISYQFRYWTRRGVPQLQPSFPFGNFGEFFRQQHGIPMTYANLYAKTKHLPYAGIYLSIQPSLLINDPQMVKNILTRDFEHFHDRGVHVNEETDPLSGNLFSLGGVKWKNLRAKLTPTFSSGCLKAMFPILVQKAMLLQNRFQIETSSQGAIEVKEMATRYTTDVIASVAFGIDIDSINNKDELFHTMGKKIFKQDLQTSLRLALAIFFPRLKALLGFNMVAPEIEDFMINVVQKTLDQRERDGVPRKDMMQLLLQLRNTGTVSLSDEQWKLDATTTAKNLTINEVAAQAFVFFVAGYETSSTLMSFCLFELARNYEIQAKVHQEIDSILSRYGGAITYDNLAEMKYLECCLDETMRKHPPVPFLNRECTKAYRIPGTDVTIDKGTPVVVSVLGMQRDSQHFPQPYEFQPERFSSSSSGEQASQDKAYFPFGGGPRLCIGLRMGVLQTKVALVALLVKFRFSLANKEDYRRELPLDAKSMLMATRDGIRLVADAR
ncbi:probable cytochrome P450 6d5 [Ochlerotatus camptorhynchus]|uniref:probable cytochrome P450 6d5 n=1 Tax=Ochlerotatus camptorhynchus TaxID=644619 RepID=UPI0031CF6E81